MVMCSAAWGAPAGGTSQTTGRKPTLVIENVTVVPMDSERMLPHHTGVIGGDRIHTRTPDGVITRGCWLDAEGLRRRMEESTVGPAC
jgi:hypothetical protein